MIDLVLLREDFDATRKALLKKDPSFPIERLAELDREIRLRTTEIESYRAQKNELSEAAKKGVTSELRERSKELARHIKEKTEQLETLTEEFRTLYLMCPNIPLEDVPAGGKESNNVIREHGKKPSFSFTPKNHVELGEHLQWINFNAASRMSGSHFALYQNEGVKLLYSLALFMLKNNIDHGYAPILPPVLVNEQSLEGASNFPRFKDEVYAVEQDKLFLTPTAEVNCSNVYRDTIFAREQLPIRMTSWTSCFRREVGGYGAAERGLIRIHQFEKVELYTICTPEESPNELDRMVACAEMILKKLDLHYRVSLLAAQDCSFASAKTYDIEVWLPQQNEYKEVSSASMCTDFQSRRCAIRYRPHAGERTHYVHTLNASSLALPRLMVAIMETYQQSNGTIEIPDVLKNVQLNWW